MIIEKMPAILNTQIGMENLFRKELPAKIRSLSKCKSVVVQRISCEDEDLRRLASYLGKKGDYKNILIDPFNSNVFSSITQFPLKPRHEVSSD